MEHKTYRKIKSYSTDIRKGNALLMLMDYYGVDRLMDISEEQAQEFLAKLRSHEVEVGDY